jgi:hypothetical protein
VQVSMLWSVPRPLFRRVPFSMHTRKCDVVVDGTAAALEAAWQLPSLLDEPCFAPGGFRVQLILQTI